MEVVIGIKNGIYEPQGATITEMTKDANGLWTVTLGPLEPNLSLSGQTGSGLPSGCVKSIMCGTRATTYAPYQGGHVDTSLLVDSRHCLPDFLDDTNRCVMERCAKRPTIRLRLAKNRMS